MEITLIRHGKSEWQESRWMTPRQFAEWIAAYDVHGVCAHEPIPGETKKKAQAAAVVMTSDLRRSIHSAERLAPRGFVETSELFREAEMPVPLARFRFVRLPLGLWLVFGRLCWFLGYSRGVESYSEARARAEKASAMLIECARAYGTVAVVGHGLFHRLVGRQLEKRGWTRTTEKRSAHWHACSYTHNM